MPKYSVVAGGPPLKTGEVLREELSAEEALDALAATKSSKGPAYVLDDRGGMVGPHELERRGKGKSPKKLP